MPNAELPKLAEIVFWICGAVIGYVYLLYPAFLGAGVLARKQRTLRTSVLKTVAIIIPAHNEANTISQKLANTRGLDYPREQLEILVGSDGSTDDTAEIVRQQPDVLLFESPSQVGKSSIQNELVSRSSGEILVFTDCDCLLAPDALRQLVANFADSVVGLVTAKPSYCNAAENIVTRNEGLYLSYESWIRKQESDRGLLAVASGSLFAIRRSLWQPVPASLGDDFFLPLTVVMAGCRNLLEPGAVVLTTLSQNGLRSLLSMKLRIISKDLLALISNPSVLNPFRTGSVAISLFSHKLVRWFVPYLLVLMFIANLLMRSSWARVTLLMQICFYLLATLGALAERRWFNPLLMVPASFCAVNLAAAVAIVQCLLGRTRGKWEPVRTN